MTTQWRTNTSRQPKLPSPPAYLTVRPCVAPFSQPFAPYLRISPRPSDDNWTSSSHCHSDPWRSNPLGIARATSKCVAQHADPNAQMMERATAFPDFSMGEATHRRAQRHLCLVRRQQWLAVGLAPVDREPRARHLYPTLDVCEQL